MSTEVVPETVLRGFIEIYPDLFPTSDLCLDTTQPGNSNAGHDFGTTLAPEQKRDLIEYLKTL